MHAWDFYKLTIVNCTNYNFYTSYNIENLIGNLCIIVLQLLVIFVFFRFGMTAQFPTKSAILDFGKIT